MVLKNITALLVLLFLSSCAAGKRQTLPPPSAVVKPPTAKTTAFGNNVATMEKALNQANDRTERIRILLNSLDNTPGAN
jgi:hypothetical protein